LVTVAADTRQAHRPSKTADLSAVEKGEKMVANIRKKNLLNKNKASRF